jgi:FeS assembly SUF system protein
MEREEPTRENIAGEQPVTDKQQAPVADSEPRPEAPVPADERKGLCQSDPHPEPLPHSSLSALVIEAQVIDALETVFDPEIPVNIYELGLIYDVKVSETGYVDITMTLTAPGCPAAQTLPVEVEQKVRDVPGVVDAKVEITFDPPWSMERMSDAARLQLGFM